MSSRACVVGLLALVSLASTSQGVTIFGSAAGGLSAEAEFTLENSTTLKVRLRNTSTGVPSGFTSSDQLLTSVAWDFGAPGSNALDVTIIGGTVLIGPTSQALNFSAGAFGANANVSGEWGYGNSAQSGLLTNFLTALQAGSTAFSATNLDGPSNLDGPQGGLVSSSMPVSLGGLGAIRNEIVATLTLSGPISNLSFLNTNQVRFEFGSDAAFITVPAPSALAMLAPVALLGRRRRR